LSRLRPTAGVGIGVAAAIILALLIGGCGGSKGTTSTKADGTSPTSPPAQGPVVVSQERLRDLADSVDYPIYWAGPRPRKYELTVDANANIFIRYLEEGELAGSRKTTSLTIATYRLAKAYRLLKSASRQPGATVGHTPDGGLVVAATGSRDNVHIAYPQRDIQVEVYDPHPGRSLELARAGRIVPVG
jgi:hypothetical protein